MSNEVETPRIIHVEKVESTNSYLRELLRKEKLPEGSFVVAGNQEAGRGQIGNSWESAPGANLTFSIVIYPEHILANQQFIISQIAALSVKETLDYYTEGITIKWPNDIYWNDKKICGMLIENDLAGQHIYSSILGIGININQESFISDAPNPVSLYQITNKKYDLKEILKRFTHIFFKHYLSLLQETEEEIRKEYKNSLYRREGFHTYSDDKGLFEAEIDSIEPTGHLLLKLRNGEVRRYAFKEVSYVKE